MDWNMLIVLLGGMLLGAGGMGLVLRRRPPREQQYARDMAMLRTVWNSFRRMGNTPL